MITFIFLSVQKFPVSLAFRVGIESMTGRMIKKKSSPIKTAGGVFKCVCVCVCVCLSFFLSLSLSLSFFLHVYVTEMISEHPMPLKVNKAQLFFFFFFLINIIYNKHSAYFVSAGNCVSKCKQGQYAFMKKMMHVKNDWISTLKVDEITKRVCRFEEFLFI